jgi:hypothetical protein
VVIDRDGGPPAETLAPRTAAAAVEDERHVAAGREPAQK